MTVPHKWVQQNNKFLYWPKFVKKNELEIIRKDANSEPNVNWAIYPCNVKFQNLTSFESATEIEKQLVDCTDTEAEEL